MGQAGGTCPGEATSEVCHHTAWIPQKGLETQREHRAGRGPGPDAARGDRDGGGEGQGLPGKTPRLTSFSSSAILFSCWWICWFFISSTCFRLLMSSSKCR